MHRQEDFGAEVSLCANETEKRSPALSPQEEVWGSVSSSRHVTSVMRDTQCHYNGWLSPSIFHVFLVKSTVFA